MLPSPRATPRPLAAAIIDVAFTVDLEEAVCGPVTLRGFASGPVVQTGTLAEHGTAIACALSGTRWPRGGAPGTRLLCAMTGHDGGEVDGGAVARALRWVAAEDVDVVVLPMGSAEADPDVEEAIGDLLARPRPPLVMAALGNSFPAGGLFPARLPQVCAVAAVDREGRLLPDAARAPWPDIVAPGDRVPVRAGVSRVAAMSGSSIACAVAAGAALRRLAAAPGELPLPSFVRALQADLASPALPSPGPLAVLLHHPSF